MRKKANKKQNVEIAAKIPLRDRSLYKYALEGFAMLSCVVAVLGYLSQRSQKPPPSQAAGKLQAMIGGIPIREDQSIALYLGLRSTTLDGAYIALFPFGLRNNGESTIRNISTVCEFPEIFRGSLPNLMKIRTEGALRGSAAIKMDNQTIGDKSVQTIHVDALDPGVTAGFDQPIPFHESQIFLEEEIKPGVKVRFKMQYGYRGKFQTYAENVPTSTYSATLSMLAADDESEFVKRVRQVVTDQMNNERASWPWWKQMFLPQRKTIIRAIAEPKLEHEVPEGKLYVVRFDPNSFHEDTLFRRLSWTKWAYVICTVLCLLVIWAQRRSFRKALEGIWHRKLQ